MGDAHAATAADSAPTHTEAFSNHASNYVRPDFTIGSNDAGPHEASTTRPVYHPSYDAVSSETGYRIRELMIGEPAPEPLKVLVIGAGAAGLDFIHHATENDRLKNLNVEFKVVEKNPDVGGTWYENRYPGCACDIPSASYQFAWAPNPHWTSYYSTSQEIWKYMKGIAETGDMYKHITLNTRVVKADWNEEKGAWVVVLRETKRLPAYEDGERKGADREETVREWTEEANLLLNATGFLK
jgi:hypothetical protein